MTIRFEKMIPLPLLEQNIAGSEVWETESVLFEQGKSYLIVAPSGKGKTTLLSAIYGLRKDFHGNVFLDETNVSGLSWKDWAKFRKNNLSYIFQGLELFDSLTALDNILLKNSISQHKPIKRIKEMAGLLGIEEFLQRKAGILSFGQQQRVAILRALCQPFNFLLADECFSHMDHENRRIAFELILEECNANGAGLILTSLDETPLFNAWVKMKL